MQTIKLYSSVPIRSAQLACALLNLESQGMHVQQLPLEQLPAAKGLRIGAQRAELETVCVRLAEIGDTLTWHEDGHRLLEAGVLNGLLAERDSLTSRKRGLEQTLRALKGGQADGP